MAVVGGEAFDQLEVPRAKAAIGGEGGGAIVDRVDLRPSLLVEGLDDRVGSGESLAEPEAEGDFAVGQVGDDLAGGPFARCGSGLHHPGIQACEQARVAAGGRLEHRHGIGAGEKACVGVEFHVP